MVKLNLFSNMDVQIPPGLTELMQDFTVAALREKPNNIVDFAADYFVKLKESKKQYDGGDARLRGVQFSGATNNESDGSSDEEPGQSHNLYIIWS